MPDKDLLPRNIRLKLLIVDDEPAIRSMLVQIFTRSGHSVRACAGGSSALSGIRHDTPDILISDLNMPGMSGFELLAVVHRQFPEVKTIAMSGAYSGDDVPPGVQADAFYRKASGLLALTRIVNDVAARGIRGHRSEVQLVAHKPRRMPSGIHLV